jgi:ABC-type nitrate/sulfonate/bicarbonate transport system substrate-binding protein
MRCGRIIFVAAFLLLLAKSVPSTPQPATLDFNYGIPSSDQTAIYVAQDLNLYAKAGLNPRFYLFASGAPLLAALKSQSIDVTTTGLAIMFALGQHIPLKLLFWVANDGIAEGLVANPKSGIQSYKDLNSSRRIGAASGTCAQVALYMLSKKLGLDYSKLNVVNIPAPLFHNAFLSNSIDAGIAWSPYSFALRQEGFPIVDFDPAYTLPGGDCPRLTAVRSEFLRAHPEIGTKLVRVETLAAQAIARNPQVAIDALVEHLKIPESVARADFEGNYRLRPTFAQQLDPASPYSLTSKDGGLVRKLYLAGQALYAAKTIPAPVTMREIRAAIEPSYLRAETPEQAK